MLDFSKEIDFSEELETTPSLEIPLQAAAREIAEKLAPDTIKKPFFDTEFNNLIISTIFLHVIPSLFSLYFS